jgi:DNA gyrase subunit B
MHAETSITALTEPSYDSLDIVVLSGVEAIRQRSAMYVGSTGEEGLHKLVFELVENSVDEFLAGACTRITVDLLEDGSCAVSDDGRGIPVDLHEGSGRPACEVLFTNLHSGGKFSRTAYKISGGLHGLGLTCVNALAKWLHVEIWRNGRAYTQSFARGEPERELHEIGPAQKRGTRIHFMPDADVFGQHICWSYSVIESRLRELAYLNAGLHITLKDYRSGAGDEFRFASGVRGLVADMNEKRDPLHPEVIYWHGAADGVRVEAALQWTGAFAPQIASFVNSIRTSSGGTHVEGLQEAIVQSVTQAVSGGDGSGEVFSVADVSEGLGAVLSVQLATPQFDSQTKAQLVNLGVAGTVSRMLSRAVLDYFKDNPQVANIVVRKAKQAREARLVSNRLRAPIRFLRQQHGHSADVYRKQFGIRSRNWHDSCIWLTDTDLLRAHADLCRVTEDARMLDVCCGSGIVGASFGAKVREKIGLDITPEMRQLAKTRLDDVLAGSIYDMPFSDGEFDIAVTREVIHILPMVEKPLSEVLRVLRPGGQFIVGQTVPYCAIDAPWMFRIFKKKQPLFFNNFLAEDIVALLAKVGFERIECVDMPVWEPIDLWIDTHETTALHRREIRDLYYNAPGDVRDVHPFEIAPDGQIRDCWRWSIFSAFKPL